ncbi:MAG: hypothetical protein ACTIDY_13590 [Halomonadaceae bacterium]|uniref:Uncharacterized protein n=1 Tax=Halomonas colorata TaxID=2742615 RepID=A0ABR9G1N9_9GAMM|nr:hypothetical protein [Halomonas colorata]MBE0464823.1 hypothetical protein [Halomonas colorata]
MNMEHLYNVFANTPWWFVCALIFCGFGFACWHQWKTVADRRKVTSFEANSNGSKIKKSLGKIEVIVGIVSGVIGSIIGVIQIGIFFGWWPKVLGSEESAAFIKSNVGFFLALFG